MKFAHISPLNTSSYATAHSGIHLALAHLVEQYGEDYCRLFQDGKDIILDNSAFELYKQGKPMYPSDKLIEMGRKINADYIVLSDYPNEPASKTIQAAVRLIPEFKQVGYKTFFVPQSQIGDLEDYIECVEWALANSDIDLIGVSILGVPNAYGVERSNNLQRFLSRWRMMNLLKSRGLLNDQTKRRFHFLGMVDGPNEIDLVNDFLPYINSWDTSAAVWAGLNDIRFDDSPTGLINGKFEKEVDFNHRGDVNDDVVFNINYINNKLQQ